VKKREWKEKILRRILHFWKLNQVV
jgi:hypothetical protein